jgi:sterol desaturase/sphingolipid hydroxylase (fatty acid hydroxylase superfamily)
VEEWVSELLVTLNAGPEHLPWATGLCTVTVLWQLTLWSTVLFFRGIEACSRNRQYGMLEMVGARRKLMIAGNGKTTKTEPAFATKLPRCVGNMLMLLLLLVATYAGITIVRPNHFYFERWDTNTTYLPSVVGGMMKDHFLLRYLYSFLVALRLIAVSDLFFYYGHAAMHHYRWFKQAHALHHASYASDAIGGYYMGAP